MSISSDLAYIEDVAYQGRVDEAAEKDVRKALRRVRAYLKRLEALIGENQSDGGEE